jgi:rhamnosyltransferase
MSTDATVDTAHEFGFEVLIIPRSEFNHGGTRQMAVEHLVDCDVIVFLTQDALLASPMSIRELCRCFDDPSVAVAYGRQLPRIGATAIEAHARIFNYGPVSRRKDASTIRLYGAKTFFCSNSFAAYRRNILLHLGGFRCDLILAEDAEYAARSILAGYANVYCAAAIVRHSHDYTIIQQFSRYFDLGVFEAGNPWLRREFGSQGGEGLLFVASELKYLLTHAAWQIPRALAQTCAKLVGYSLGARQKLLSSTIKRKLSMSPNYWG